MSSKKAEITVIGAGVQGLSAACLLQARGYQVTIVGHSTPAEPAGDRHFTSPKAGANWFSFAEDWDTRLQGWDAVTLQTFNRLAVIPNIGIWQLPCNQYWESIDGFKDPWYASIVDNYVRLSTSSIPPNYAAGVQFNTVTINVPLYLKYLTSTFLSLGGIFHTIRQLSHITDAFTLTSPPPSIVVNCTGLGSIVLGGVEDTNVYPTRGQTVLVRAPAVKRTVMDVGGGLGSSVPTYVIPRGDGTVILGGTYQPGDWQVNLDPDPDTANQIIQRCIKVCPEVVPPGESLPHVLSHDVGLRPTRTGGVRLEVEEFDVGNGQSIPVIHNYGHGGYGYQSSWGCAADVVLLAERQLTDGVDAGTFDVGTEKHILDDLVGVLVEKAKA